MPNYATTDLTVYLEKNEVKFEDDQGNVRTYEIQNRNGSIISASNLIAWPGMDRDTINYMNTQIDTRYSLDIESGFIKAILKPHYGADQEMIELLKDTKEVIETQCELVNLYPNQEQDTLSTQNSSQNQQYESTAETEIPDGFNIINKFKI